MDNAARIATARVGLAQHREEATAGGWAFPEGVSHRSLIGALLIALLGLALLPFTAHTHPWIYNTLQRLPLRSVLSTMMQFATVGCITACALAIVLLDAPRRRYVIYLVLAVLSAGAVNGLAKQVSGRARPPYSIMMGSKEKHHLEKYVAVHPGSPISTGPEDKWLLFSSHRPFLMDEFGSFPSGHAAAAFAFAAFLVVLYPRGRLLWLVLAVMCAIARVRFRRHFTEDVLFGAGIGWVIAAWVFTWKWPARLSAWAAERL